MSEYGEWNRYETPFSFDLEGTIVTVVGDGYEVSTGRRQHLILEDIIINKRNADWISVKDIMEL